MRSSGIGVWVLKLLVYEVSVKLILNYVWGLKMLVEKMHNLIQSQRTTLDRKRNPKRMLNTCSGRDCCNPRTKVHKRGYKNPPHPHKRKYFKNNYFSLIHTYSNDTTSNKMIYIFTDLQNDNVGNVFILNITRKGCGCCHDNRTCAVFAHPPDSGWGWQPIRSSNRTKVAPKVLWSNNVCWIVILP